MPQDIGARLKDGDLKEPVAAEQEGGIFLRWEAV